MVYNGRCGKSPRQESNLDLTLRRRVHYPLCYGESARSIRVGLAPQHPAAQQQGNAAASPAGALWRPA